MQEVSKKQFLPAHLMTFLNSRIWALILVGELAIFLVTFLFFGQLAFFWLGPFLTYNLLIFYFPQIYFSSTTKIPTQFHLPRMESNSPQHVSNFSGSVEVPF